MEDRQPDETSNLLDQDPAKKRPAAPDPLRTILSAAVVLLILQIASQLELVPETAILQDIICRKYYEGLDLDPSIQPDPVDRCKIEPVQAEVAYINGWTASLGIIPAMLVAVPYGTLADRIGRKPVLLLAIVGCFMNDIWIRLVYWFPDIFPLRTVWLGGLWQAIGGGATTLSSILFVLVADVCPPEQRTTAFSQIQSATLLSKLLFVPLGGYLSSVNPWLPMFIASIIMIVGFCVAVLFVPETLPFPAAPGNGNDEAPLPSSTSGNHDDDKQPLRIHLRKQLDHLATFGQWMLSNTRVGLVILCFFLFHLGEQASGTILLQYAAKRLGWTLGEASYLISLSAGVYLFVLAVMIPAMSTFLLHRLRLHETAKDKHIAQVSGVFLVVGSWTLFFAASWAVLVLGQFLTSLGYAITIPARSIVTSMVEQKHLGALYTAVSVLTYAGVLTGGPLFAATFQWGLRLENFWLGMPFFVAGACFVLALLAVSAAATGGRGEEVLDEVGSGDEESSVAA
ncbi:major facilitator superfamily domain-containing protein [Apodospora peruviana]|uniref:Major facilitator superfamily domain-containing protein n=1 Tax=Apodospora peruviana TaxID=516989 RepID=A0AAE0MER9_9PEZI|nr:major facilitator superfamily domain-containing protein [Apodospora peruviana]